MRYPHQLRFNKIHNNNPFIMLRGGPGSGKTVMAIDNMAYKYGHYNNLQYTFIFAPSVILNKWVNDLTLFLDASFNIFLVDGQRKDKLNKIRKIKEENDKAIIVLNYQSLSKNEKNDGFKIFEEIKNTPNKMLILDEIQNVRNKSSDLYKLMVKIADKSTYKIGMTGTIYTNDVSEIYTQFRIVDGGRTFGKKIGEFYSKYCEDVFANVSKIKFPKWKFREDAIEELKLKIHENSFTLSEKEYEERLPLLYEKNIYLDMEKPLAENYKLMKKNGVIRVRDHYCFAKSKMTRGLRLFQLANCFAPLDNDDIHLAKTNHKINWLRENLPGIIRSRKAAIWYCYQSDLTFLQNLMKVMDINYVVISGKENSKNKYKNIEKFEKDESVKIALANTSVGIGFDLVQSFVSIYYNRDYSLEKEIQSCARNRRINSPFHKVWKINLITNKSIEEKISKRLEEKRNHANLILNYEGENEF